MKSNKIFAAGRHTLMTCAAVLAASLAFMPASVLAYDVKSTSAVNIDKNGVILRNFDPTTYEPNATPKIGTAEFTATADGAVYHFASSSARNQFVAKPADYEPAFGGFCATGAAFGKKLDGDPEIFRILDGKLYVFVNQQAVEVWDKDPAGTLAKANANWPVIRDKTPESL